MSPPTKTVQILLDLYSKHEITSHTLSVSYKVFLIFNKLILISVVGTINIANTA